MKMVYQVWAIGYNKDDTITDVAEMLGEFKYKKDAMWCAERFSDMNQIYREKPDFEYMTIEVEYVKVFRSGDEEAEDSDVVNTIYWNDNGHDNMYTLENVLSNLTPLNSINIWNYDDYTLNDTGNRAYNKLITMINDIGIITERTDITAILIDALDSILESNGNS